MKRPGTGVLRCISDSDFPAMPSFRRQASLALLLFLICAVIAWTQHPPASQAIARANTRTGALSPAEDLARRILAVTGPHASISFTFENRSSLGIGEATALRRAIESSLSESGARLGSEEQAAIAIHVTLSQSWRNRLLIAQIQEGPTQKVVMAPFPMAAPISSGVGETGPGITLTRRLVFRQSAAFLSFLEWASPADHAVYLWLLEPDRLAVARRIASQSQWQWLSEAPISHPQPWPRDPRGLLSVQPILTVLGGVPPAEWLVANLPGVECSLKLMEAGNQPAEFVSSNGALSLACRSSSAPNAGFPIFEGLEEAATVRLAPGRNFFDGAIHRSNVVQHLAPFYSATIIHKDHNQPVLVAAGIDGKATLYDIDGKAEGIIDGWGSNVAGIQSGCGSGWQVLADQPGDWTQNDELTAYEIVEGKAVPAAEPMEFSGPIMSLAAEPVPLGARAVVLNRDTGVYEAYSITVSCGR